MKALIGSPWTLTAIAAVFAAGFALAACDGASGPACSADADCTDGLDYCAASAGDTCCARGTEGCGCFETGLCDEGLDCSLCAGAECNNGDGVCQGG